MELKHVEDWMRDIIGDALDLGWVGPRAYPRNKYFIPLTAQITNEATDYLVENPPEIYCMAGSDLLRPETVQ